MAPAFATNMRVMLGADDIDTNDELLRHDDGADEQGSTRLERGLNFYLKAREAADDQSLPFDWSCRPWSESLTITRRWRKPHPPS